MKNSRNYYKIKNLDTGTVINENDIKQTRNISYSVLEVTYDYQKIKRILTKPFLNKNIPSIDKYYYLFPIQKSDRLISLNEGNTPLYKSLNIIKNLGLENLYFKHEGFNPTGAFKDRGSVVEITKALAYKAKAIVLASTGNMAASISAYSAKAHIPCFVFIPDSTPESKLAQTLYYGAKIIKVRGAYDQAAQLAIECAKKYNFFLAGDYAFRAEGQKSQAYEIILQLGLKSPDYIFVPVGNGTNMYAIWKGFNEFYEMHIIDKLPKMIGIQVVSYNAIYQAYKRKALTIKPISQTTKTVATAIAVKNPSDAGKVLKLIRESKGEMMCTTDREIIKAQADLAKSESIFAEPSSLVVYAGLKKYIKRHKLNSKSKIVCVLTGHGLKDPVSGLNSLTHSIYQIKSNIEINKIFNQIQ